MEERVTTPAWSWYVEYSTLRALVSCLAAPSTRYSTRDTANHGVGSKRGVPRPP